MSSLAQLQQLFWASVRVDPAPRQVDESFVTRGGMSGRVRMSVYRTAYWFRQVGALQELFPSVVRLLGDGPFARHASHFIAQHPSTSWAIELLGRDFAQWAGDEISSEVGRLAAIDWLRFSAVIAPNETPISIEPAQLVETHLKLAAHVGICSIAATQLAQSGSGLEWNETTPELAVWRDGHAVLELLVDAREAAAMVATREGVLFPRWCELLLADGTEEEAAATHALSVLQRWLARGWLVAKERT